MLSKEQKEKLRKISIYASSSKEKNGVAIITKTVSKVKWGKKRFSHIEEVFVVPSCYDIAESVFKQILDSGFSKVERASPSDANCIVRVFQKLHYQYDPNMIFNMYGADVFCKEGEMWVASCNCFTLDYEKCSMGERLNQSEVVFFDSDFVDFYVKVS